MGLGRREAQCAQPQRIRQFLKFRGDGTVGFFVEIKHFGVNFLLVNSLWLIKNGRPPLEQANNKSANCPNSKVM
jgi:hypothetical protein